jgi:hypothetical protein
MAEFVLHFKENGSVGYYVWMSQAFYVNEILF